MEKASLNFCITQSIYNNPTKETLLKKKIDNFDSELKVEEEARYFKIVAAFFPKQTHFSTRID